MKRNDMSIHNIPFVITACCILHNICKLHGDSFNDLWLENVDMSTQPETPRAKGSNAHNTAKAIRNALVKYYS